MAKGEVYRFTGTDAREVFEVIMTSDSSYSNGYVSKVIKGDEKLGRVNNWSVYSNPRVWTLVSSEIPMEEIYRL